MELIIIYDNMVEGGRENKKIYNNIDTKKKKNFVCLFVCLRRGLTYIDSKYHFPFNNQQEEIFDLVL